MKKRWIAVFCMVVFCISTFVLILSASQPVNAADTVPSGYTAVRTEADLAAIRNNMSGKYILMNDLTLSESWISLGYDATNGHTPFTGILDGNGHTLTISKLSGYSFVYQNQGTIKNLTFAGSLKVTYRIGVVCYSNQGLVQNCHNKVVVTGSVYATSLEQCGGLVMSNQAAGIVEYCSNQADINLKVIRNSSNLNDKGLHLGGIVGQNSGTIRKSWNSGNITAIGGSSTSAYAAGIVGYGIKDSLVEDCYNSGTIYAKQDFSSSFSYNYGAAGIIVTVNSRNGVIPTMSIKNCYNVGNCSVYAPYSSKYVGAITGYAPNTTYKDCYFLEGTATYGSRDKTPVNVTKLTSSQMCSQSSFQGFDFSGVWKMSYNASYRYPVLKTVCTHQVDRINAKEATCTSDGNVLYWYCNICGYYFSNSSKTTQLTYSNIRIPKGHSYDSGAVTKPTCTEDGYTTYTCVNCGDSYTADAVSATGHNHTGVITTEPTCTEEGIKTFTCAACGDAYTEPVSALGHDEQNHNAQAATCTEIGWGAYVTCSRCDYSTYQEIGATGHNYQGVVTAPTCTAEGYTTYTCTNCVDSYTADYVIATGHNHTGVITTEPTCTEEGIKTFTCSACGDAYTEPVSALGHDPQNHSAQAATCTHIGWKDYVTCSRCAYSTYQEIGATGHNYQGVVTEPTCTEDGYTTYTCVNCGDSYTADAVSATGHNHTGVVTTKPTCTEDGVKTFTCTACGDSYTESVSALGHNYDSRVKQPTCTKDGYTTYTCSRCDDSYIADYVDATGHSYDAGVVTTKPTCTEEGVKTFTCSACDDQYTESVSELGHKYFARVTMPTCTKEGYTTYTCSRCDDSYIADYVDATGHSYDAGVVTTKPTCTEEGVKTFTCSACDDQYTESVSALGHDYTEGICQICGSEDPEYIPSVCGDVNGDGEINNIDVEYLLWNTLFPEDYPLSVNADYDANGVIDNLDVEYLLWHTLFPEEYPLVKKEELL